MRKSSTIWRMGTALLLHPPEPGMQVATVATTIVKCMCSSVGGGKGGGSSLVWGVGGGRGWLDAIGGLWV